MANQDWFSIFKNSSSLGLPIQRSDHGPLIINSKSLPASKPRPFKLEQFLLDLPDFSSILSKSWNSYSSTTHQSPASTSFKLAKKLESLKREIKEWNKTRVGNIFQTIANIQKDLEEKQSNPHLPHNVNQDSALRSQLDALLEAEDIYWKQRVKIEWDIHGDVNSKL